MTSLWSDFQGTIVEQELLAAHTTFAIGGPARWFARPDSVDQLGRLVRRCREMDIPLLTLGLGANLLVSDEGINAMVVRLSDPGFCRTDWPNDQPALPPLTDGPIIITTGGGTNMFRLVPQSVRYGLAGLEGLAGIPGTIGGCLRMNAGGRWGEIADRVLELTVINEAGEIEVLTAKQAGFCYRSSNLEDKIIYQVKLGLYPEDPQKIRAQFLKIWTQKSRSQPLDMPSAGCIFKNPPGQSAGRLIEQAGLKGISIGGATVSTVHANFIITQEGATAVDVYTLINRIRRQVADRFGVELETEIKLWGRQHTRNPEPTF